MEELIKPLGAVDFRNVRKSISDLTAKYVPVKKVKGLSRDPVTYRACRREIAREEYRLQKRPAVFGENRSQALKRKITETLKPKRVRKPRAKKIIEDVTQ